MARGLLVVVLGVSAATCRIGDLIGNSKPAVLKVQYSEDALRDSSAFGSTALKVDTIGVSNEGGGELQWHASVKNHSPWLTLDPDSGTAGTTPTLQAKFDPSGLDIGDYADTVIVEALSGTGSLSVPLRYKIYPCKDSLIAVGDSVSAFLTTADCGAPHREGRFAKLYRFSGAANDSVTIEVPAAFDAYVALDTSLAANRPPLIAKDDCLGAAGDPCIYYARLPGTSTSTYWVEVTSADSADTGAFKLRLLRKRKPNIADSLAQFTADSTTPVDTGGVASQVTIVLRAVISDPDLADVLQLQAEVLPVGQAFTGVPTAFSGAVPNGSPAYVRQTVEDTKSYHWRVRAVDETGLPGDWKEFPSPAFTVQSGHDPTFANANQYQSNTTTLIPVGDTANGTTVVFKAQLNDVDVGNQLFLQIEAEPVGTGFDSVATAASAPVAPGATATVTVPGLTIGANYHWQARVVDNTTRHSGWASFGGNAESATDFHVSQPPAQLNWVVQPGATATAGIPISGFPQVAVQDQNGVTITTFSGPVTMAISTIPSGGQVTLLGTTTVNASSGIATFQNLIIDTAKVGYRLTATAPTASGTISSAESNLFNVTAAPATQLVFTVQPPPSTTAGVVMTPAIKVSAEDQFGNVDPTFTAAVAMGLGTSPSGDTLSGVKVMNAAAGVATFSSLRVRKTGNGYTLQATRTGLTSATSTPFNITPAPATHLVFTVPPSGAQANVVFTPPVQVSALDSINNLATSFAGNVTVAIGTNPSGGTLTGTLTKATSLGVAQFSDLKIDKAGVGYTLTASTLVVGVASGTSPSFTISISTPDPALSTVVASPATITACNSGCSPAASTASTITVTAKDNGGNVVPNVSATISVTGNGNNVVGLNPQTTNASGQATWTLNSTVASATPAELKIVSASIQGQPINQKDTVTVNPGQPVALEFTNLVGNTTAGAAINSGSGVLVRARDQFTNTATSFNGGVTMTIAAPAGGALAPTSTNNATASSGIANFPNLRIYQAGTGYQLRASSGTLTPGLSNTFTINAGAPNTLAFTTQPTTTAVLARIDSAVGGVVVSVQDSVGNTVPFGGTVQVVIGNNAGGGTLTGGNAISAPTGIATFANLRINAVGTGYTLVTTSSGPSLISDQSNSFDIVTGPPAKLAFLQNPTNATAGTTISPPVTVQIQDANGFLTTSNASVTLAITPGTGTSGSHLSGTLTVAAVNGTATFNNLSIDSVGTGYRLNATSGPLTGGTSSTFSITTGPASKLAFGQQPTTTTAGATISPAPTVRILDALGNQTASTAPVTLAITAGTGKTGAHLSGGSQVAVNAINGVATFSTLTIDSVGAGYTLTATSAGLTSTISSTFNINAGAATQLVFTKPPTNTTAGAIINQATGGVVVTARDAQGNTATSFTSNVTISIVNNAGPGGQLLGTTTRAAAAGVATFNDLSINKTGTGYTLGANGGAFSITSTPFNITAGTATQLIITTQPSSSAQSGVALGTQPVVQVADAQGNPVNQNGTLITATIALSPGGSPSLTSPTATTNASGTATFSGLTITGLVGGYRLRFAGGSLTPDTSATITLSAGAATKLAITTAPSSSTQSGVPLGTQPVLQIQDASGNPVSQGSTLVTATIATGPGGSSLTNATATTNASGTATFSGLTITGPLGNYTLDFDATSLATATSGTITVSSGNATKLGITTQPSSSAQSGVAFAQQPVIQIQDGSGNPVSQGGTLITATVASGPGGATLSGATATTNANGTATFTNLAINGLVGTYSLNFNGGGLTQTTSNSITLSTGPATKLTITTQPSSSAQSGVAFAQQPVIQLRDAGGNPVSQSNVQVTAAIASGPSGTLSNATANTNASGAATFSGLAITGPAGDYTLSFGSGSLTPVTSNTITLSAGSATKLGITTQPSSTAQAGVAFSTQPVIQVQDASGNPVSQNGTLITATIASGPGGATLSNPTATTNASGTATFSALAINGLVGTYTLTFSGGGLTPITSNAITLSTGPATKLAFTVQPSNAVAGAAISPAVQVVVQDAGGNPVTAPRRDITVAPGANPGNGTLSGTLTVQTAGGTGISTFNNLSIDKAASGYTLVASATGLTSATSSTFTIAPAAAATLSFTTPPQSTASGSTMSPIVLTAFDAFGNVATGFSGNVTLAITTGTPTIGGPGVLGGTTTVAASGGVATFSDLSITGAGTGYTLDATSALPTVTSNPFDIN